VVPGYDVDVDVRDGLAGGFPVVHPYGEGVASVGAAYSPLLCAHFVPERHPFVLAAVTEMLDVPSGDDEGVSRVDRVVVFGGDRQGPRPHDDTSFQPVRAERAVRLTGWVASLIFSGPQLRLVRGKVPFEMLADLAPDWVASQLRSRFPDPQVAWDLVSEGWSGTAAQLESVVGG